MSGEWTVERVKCHQETHVEPIYDDDGEETGERVVLGDDCSYWRAHNPLTKEWRTALTRRRLREIIS
jgi:hypothetical protein